MGELAEFSASAPDFGALFGAKAGKGAIPLRDRAKGVLAIIGHVRAETISASGLCRAGAGVFYPSVTTHAAPMPKSAVMLYVKAPALGTLYYCRHAVYGAGGCGGVKKPEVPGGFFSKINHSGPLEAALWRVPRLCSA